MRPDDRGGADSGGRHPGVAETTGRHPTPWHQPWPRSLGVAIRSSFRGSRSSCFRALPSSTAGRSRVGTAARVRTSRLRSPGRARRRARARSRWWSTTPTPRRGPLPTGSAGRSTPAPRGSARARPHRSRGATTSAATEDPARPPATAPTATRSGSTARLRPRTAARRRQARSRARPGGPHPGRGRADRHLRALGTRPSGGDEDRFGWRSKSSVLGPPLLRGDGLLFRLAHRRLGGLGLGLLLRRQLRLDGRRPWHLRPRYGAGARLRNVRL